MELLPIFLSAAALMAQVYALLFKTNNDIKIGLKLSFLIERSKQ